MGHDAMAATGASVPSVASRDAGKKKRNNRSAKLKQCKLDARREQWLSKVKGRGDSKVMPASSLPSHSPRLGPGEISVKERAGVEERDELVILDENSDLDSPTNNSDSSRNRMQKIFPSNSISGSSFGSWSHSVSDMEEETEGGDEENGVLDDWEAVADALSEDDRSSSTRAAPIVDGLESASSPNTQSEALCVENATGELQPVQSIPKAWRPDDASRPQSLPSITKQWSFPSKVERRLGSSQHKGILLFQASCPICCEDLDPTDSSFLPCSCGFRLCLFCHKRILEADGRCPGCRKKYDLNFGGIIDANKARAIVLPGGFGRSYSMSVRF